LRQSFLQQPDVLGQGLAGSGLAFFMQQEGARGEQASQEFGWMKGRTGTMTRMPETPENRLAFLKQHALPTA
jgi:hypothetical protein